MTEVRNLYVSSALNHCLPIFTLYSKLVTVTLFTIQIFFPLFHVRSKDVYLKVNTSDSKQNRTKQIEGQQEAGDILFEKKYYMLLFKLFSVKKTYFY